MITVSTKRLYLLGKIEASPKGLAITSNLSSGKEVGVTEGGGGERRIFVEETGHLREDPPPLRVSCLFLSPYIDGAVGFFHDPFPPPPFFFLSHHKKPLLLSIS